jgi:hypothetical protein
MTPAAHRRYLWEWGQARKWFRAHGLDPQQAEAKRHALHAQALGRDKSSKDLTNGELTMVLAAFRAIYDGGNLSAQLDAEDDPERRVDHLRANARAIAAECVSHEGSEGAYLDGLSRRIGGASFENLDERKLQILVGILIRRKKQLQAANPF